jgi:hypothetical protein
MPDVLLGVVEHSILQIELDLPAEQNAGVEDVLDTSSSILLIEIAQILEDVCVLEGLFVNIILLDDAMRHLRELSIVSHQLIGLKLVLIRNLLVLLPQQPLRQLAHQMVLEKLHVHLHQLPNLTTDQSYDAVQMRMRLDLMGNILHDLLLETAVTLHSIHSLEIAQHLS